MSKFDCQTDEDGTVRWVCDDLTVRLKQEKFKTVTAVQDVRYFKNDDGHVTISGTPLDLREEGTRYFVIKVRCKEIIGPHPKIEMNTLRTKSKAMSILAATLLVGMLNKIDTADAYKVGSAIERLARNMGIEGRLDPNIDLDEAMRKKT